MNKERMLGIFANLLLECQESGLLTNEGNNKVLRILIDNLKEK